MQIEEIASIITDKPKAAMLEQNVIVTLRSKFPSNSRVQKFELPPPGAQPMAK